MEDLFNQFKDNLENRPEPTYDAQYWERLRTDLDRQDKPARSGLWLWWAIPMALLLASNIYFLLRLQRSDTSISNNTSYLSDTIYRTQVIYQTDTIYKTTIQKEQTIQYLKERPSLFDPTIFSNRQAAFFQSITNEQASLGHILQTRVSSSPLRFGITSNLDEATEAWTATESLPHLGLDLLSYPRPLGEINTAQNVNKKRRKSISQYLYQASPKGLSVGINGGRATPLNEGLYNKNGYSLGLEANIAFSSGLHLWLNSSYINISFETDRMDEAIGIPTIAPPTDDFVFEKAEAPQHSIQYSAGLQYYFNHQKKWKPFVGIGFGAVSSLPYEVTYEFDNMLTNLEWNFEETVNNRQLITDFLLFRAGVEYQINQRWAWQLRSSYRTNYNSIGFQSPRLFNIQTGFNFKIR